MRRAVAYCATRNLYKHLAVSLCSLFYNTPEIDAVYLFLEDDNYTEYIDDRIIVKNVRKIHSYLWRESANYNSCFTYMSLVRLEFPAFIPEEDIVLYLDVDTICDKNISGIWETDISKSYIAAVPEKWHRLTENPDEVYINAGVMLMNLEQMRERSTMYEFMAIINTNKKLLYPDQDCINAVCAGSIVKLDPTYNEFHCTQESFTPAIVHYAGYKDYWKPETPRHGYYRKYLDILAEKR